MSKLFYLFISLSLWACNSGANSKSNRTTCGYDGTWVSHFDFSKVDSTNANINHFRTMISITEIKFMLHDSGNGYSTVKAGRERADESEPFKWLCSNDTLIIDRDGQIQKFEPISADSLKDLTYIEENDPNYAQHYLVRESK